jgi:Zn-dependent peptidase ImmA (M78 family)/transcriptional regulator with XRE-family HTH domain
MSINGDRVRQAREIRGLTQAELAERVGVSQPAIAQIERAIDQQLFEPSSEIMEAIALQTGFPLQFFRQESGPELPLGSLLYRTRTSLLSSQDKRRFNQLTRLVYEIAEKMVATPGLNTIPIRLPRVLNEDPIMAARVTRTHLGLSPDSPVKNLLNQIEKNGVFVFALPYTIDEHDAFSFWSDSQPRRPIIVISEGKPGDRQRFTLAHELGHLVMHYSFPQGLKKVEDEANQFASEFLMPAEALRQEITTPVTLTSLAELKPKWGVAIAALILRARDLGIITERQSVHLLQKKRKLEWDKNEPPNLYIKPEKPRALKRMAELVHGVPVNIEKVAAYNLSPVGLIRDIMAAHADKPDMPKTEKKDQQEPQDSRKVVSISRQR